MQAQPDKAKKDESAFDRIARLAFVLGAMMLMFLAGAVAVNLRLPMVSFVGDALTASRALFAQHEANQQEHPEFLWYAATTEDQGLVRRSEDYHDNGYTLHTVGDDAQALLVNSQGEIVYRWQAHFSKVWPQATQQAGWIPDQSVYIRRAHAFANGDLLALYESPNQTPNGCGLSKLDRYSQVVWTYDENTHHDFAIGPARIYVLAHRLRTTPIKNWDRLRLPVLEEFVDVVSHDGQRIKRLSLLQLLSDSKFFLPVLTTSDQYGDVLHSNTINLVGEGFAGQHDGVSNGDLMICLRNVNLVVVVNPTTEKIVWATTGPWRTPHDPDPLENGNLLIFDNCWAGGSTAGSRTIEFDPRRQGEVVWQYTGQNDRPLRSDIRSCQQLLPSGNVLITESDRGRLLEVTRAGEVVWEYVHPVRAKGATSLIPVVSGGRRYPREALPFLDSAAGDLAHH